MNDIDAITQPLIGAKRIGRGTPRPKRVKTRAEGVMLVCGDRDWKDEDCIRAALSILLRLGWTEIVHGGCRGADAIAGRIGEELGYAVHPLKADWELHGRAAGPIRNKRMLDDYPRISLIVYFHDHLGKSKGTKNMIAQATKRGIPSVSGRAVAENP